MLKNLIGKKLTSKDAKCFDNEILYRKSLDEISEFINLDIFKKNPDLLTESVLKRRFDNVIRVYDLYCLYQIEDFITSSHLCLNYNEVKAKINYLLVNDLPILVKLRNNNIRLNPIMLMTNEELKLNHKYSTRELIDEYINKTYSKKNLKKQINNVIFLKEKMKKHVWESIDIDLVFDYINAKDIEGYDVDALENNPIFMKKVINISEDKNIYFLASDIVKKNYDFVLNTVKKFSNDIDFIMKVADYYLNNANVNKDDTTKQELNIVMCTLINDKDKNMKYSVEAAIYYETLLADLRYDYIEETKGIDNSVSFGLGFASFYEKYKKDPYILGYFAKRTIDKLLYCPEITIEEFINKRNLRLEDINDIVITRLIIEYISYYDISLSNYLISHFDLVNNLVYDTINKLESCYFKETLTIK